MEKIIHSYFMALMSHASASSNWSRPILCPYILCFLPMLRTLRRMPCTKAFKGAKVYGMCELRTVGFHLLSLISKLSLLSKADKPASYASYKLQYISITVKEEIGGGASFDD